jgi:ABC-2 type transport system permease protein
MTKAEAKLFLRQPVALFFQVAFPVLLLVLFGSMFGSVPLGDGSERMVVSFYLPALIGAFVAQAGLVSLPIFLANYRELGILKRYHVSPVSLSTYLGVHVTIQVAAMFVTALVMTVVGKGLFGVALPENVLGVLLVGVLGMAAFFAFGFALSGVLPSPQAGQAVGNFLFLTMFFLSGATVPHEIFPDWLVTLSYGLPLTHVVQPMAGLWLGEPITNFLDSLLVVTALIPAGILLAKRVFTWKE